MPKWPANDMRMTRLELFAFEAADWVSDGCALRHPAWLDCVFWRSLRNRRGGDAKLTAGS